MFLILILEAMIDAICLRLALTKTKPQAHPLCCYMLDGLQVTFTHVLVVRNAQARILAMACMACSPTLDSVDLKVVEEHDEVVAGRNDQVKLVLNEVHIRLWNECDITYEIQHDHKVHITYEIQHDHKVHEMT